MQHSSITLEVHFRTVWKLLLQRLHHSGDIRAKTYVRIILGHPIARCRLDAEASGRIGTKVAPSAPQFRLASPAGLLGELRRETDGSTIIQQTHRGPHIGDTDPGDDDSPHALEYKIPKVNTAELLPRGDGATS